MLCYFHGLYAPLQNAVQQSVHLTLGILRKSQAVSHALSFFWLDGFAVPAPARVTQTVGRLRQMGNQSILRHKRKQIHGNYRKMSSMQ